MKKIFLIILLIPNIRAADGGLDPSFGIGGLVTTNFGGTTDAANDLAIQPDGKIVAVGQLSSGISDFALARYNSDGSLDTTFGTGGLVVTSIGSTNVANAVAIQLGLVVLLLQILEAPVMQSMGLFYNQMVKLLWLDKVVHREHPVL